MTVDLISNYAIFSLDLDGSITSWNKGAERIKGWKEHEVLGKYFGFLYTEEQQNVDWPRKNLEVARKMGFYEEKGMRKRKNGELFYADITISQIHNEKEDKHVGYVKVVKDITEQKNEEDYQSDLNKLLKEEIDRRKVIEDALLLSNQELEAFAAAASHDLQEPLRMVISYIQLIERRYAVNFDSEGKEFLDFAIDGAIRMKTLINDLVEYSRIETLGKPLGLTDANESVKRALNNLNVVIGEQKAQITVDKLPIVISDEVQLTQVFQNLIVNAIKFKGDGPPKIHISAKERENDWLFSVADNGRGIDEKNLQTIFIIFKQLGKRSDRSGSGVGLAITKKIISRHFGEIWAESTVGIGSTIFFTLPKKHIDLRIERDLKKENTHE